MFFCELYYKSSTFVFCDQFVACNCGFPFWFARHQRSTRPPLTDELTVDSDKYHVADIHAKELSKVDNLGNERLKAVMAMLGEDLKDSVLF